MVGLRESRSVGKRGIDVVGFQIRLIRQNVCHRHATCQPLQHRLRGITQATNAWLAMANVGVARDAVHGRILLWSTTFHTMPPQPAYGRNSRRCATCCPLTAPETRR